MAGDVGAVSTTNGTKTKMSPICRPVRGGSEGLSGLGAHPSPPSGTSMNRAAATVWYVEILCPARENRWPQSTRAGARSSRLAMRVPTGNVPRKGDKRLLGGAMGFWGAREGQLSSIDCYRLANPSTNVIPTQLPERKCGSRKMEEARSQNPNNRKSAAHPCLS